MSYLTYAKLTEDVDFGRRARACINEQANALSDQTGSPVDRLAVDLLKQEGLQTVVMLNAIAAGPNFAVMVDNGDGTIDSTKISDADILAHTQTMFVEVAKIFYPSGPGGHPPGATSTVDSIDPTGTTQFNDISATITGTGLAGTTKVFIGQECTAIIATDTTVTCTVPGQFAGTYPVTLTVGDSAVTGPNFVIT